jgi:hypothetical protein
LHPWYYYFTETWRELGYSGSQLVVGLGIVMLLHTAVRGRPWMARLVFLWAALPFVAISVGTSKLLHYAYPFWPPIGLGAGLVVARTVRELDGPHASRLATWLGQLAPARIRQWLSTDGRSRRLVRGLAALTLGIALITALIGPWSIDIGAMRLFSNSSVLRPLVFGGLLWLVAGSVSTAVRLVGAIVLILILPFGRYVEKIQSMSKIDHPLRAARDCVTETNRSRGLGARGAISVSGDILHHSYYFYFWREGPWVVSKEFSPDQVEERLMDPARQTPIFISREHFQLLTKAWDANPAVSKPGDPKPTALEERAAALWDGVTVADDVALLLPGPYRGCIQPVREAGALQLWRPTSSTRGQ